MALLAPPDITGLLDDWGRGDSRALDRLVPLVYAELRRVAARPLRLERDGHSLQPAALVHEAYLRLVDQRQVHWQNRAHFFAVSELRAFGGLTIDEAAHVLKVLPSTAKRDWRTARAWLVRELGAESHS